jgi:hypothetical protein
VALARISWLRLADFGVVSFMGRHPGQWMSANVYTPEDVMSLNPCQM